MFGPIFWKQLKQSDLILLNKIDQVDSGEVPTILHEVHKAVPGCSVIPARFCNVDQEILWATPPKSAGPEGSLRTPDSGVSTPNLIEFHPSPCEGPSPTTKRKPRHLRQKADGDSSAAEDYITFSFSNTRPLDPECFDRFLKELPWKLYRVKGFVRLPDRTMHVNYVGGVGVMEPWSPQPESVLAFIGWDLDPQNILNKLKRCIVQHAP
jgi:G3E family GTPase